MDQNKYCTTSGKLQVKELVEKKNINIKMGSSADGEKDGEAEFKAKRPTGCLQHQHNTTSLRLTLKVNKQLWTS